MTSLISPFLLLLFSSELLAQVQITEFLASNDNGLEDENGNSEDWIEISNLGPTAVDLNGWSLTDQPQNTQKWTFPTFTLNPGGVLIIFASGKNRSVPGLPLHTNFSLSKGGEYLALYEPGGAAVASEFSPSYPPQATDVSFGYEQGVSQETPITLNTPGRAGVPTSEANFNSQFINWSSNLSGAFTGSSWQTVELGVGYEITSGYGDWIGTGGDVQARMFQNNSSVFIRVPFTVSSAADITTAALRMRWDDGFVAYLNGQEIASHMKPAPLSWNSSTATFRPDEFNDDPVQFNIDLSAAPLNEGANLLAIHGMNSSNGSSDMLIQPELELTRTTGTIGSTVYFTTPTPGSTNGSGESELAPLFNEVTDSAAVQPTGDNTSPPLRVTTTIQEGTAPVANVRVFFRTMFGPETSLTLNDNGTAPDAIADDAIYSGEIPTNQARPGEMLRWRFEVTDTNGGLRSSPPYLEPLDADRYYGTVASNDFSTSDLTVLHTFIENTSAVDTRGGTRASVYYLGRFYDNLQMDLHGQSSASFPKKSYDIDFNQGNRFTWLEGENKAKDINLLTNWADKSKVRNTLAYEMYERTGTAYHYAFPVRVERNGAFFSVADLVEDGDDRYLERLGLDPKGVLYKMYDGMNNVNTAAKKTRQNEDRQDLQNFYDNVQLGLGTVNLRRYYYDHIEMAALVNYLAANQVIGITDVGHKNYYWYRDTEDTEQWRPLPWDTDLSAGHHWGGSIEQYFNDDLKTGIRLQDFNPVWTTMYNTAEFQQMLARRFETLRREVLQPNGTPTAQDWVRNRIIAIEASTNRSGILSDSDLDFNKWGSWGDGLSSLPYSMRLYNDWLPAHRNVVFDFNTNFRGTSIPPTQPSTPNVTIDSVDFLPASNSQEEEYVIIKNSEPSSLDLSGWTLSGAIDFSFPPGTVILEGNGGSRVDFQGLLHIAKNPAAFRNRTSGPSGNEFRFIQGPSSGQLSARGETIILSNQDGMLIDEYTYEGTPTLGQQYLRISEIHYNPSAPTGGELLMQPGLEDRDFEFIELVNVGPSLLDLSGATFTEGITYTFPSPASLAAGQRLLLVKNTTAFSLRYPNPGEPVFGPFSGQLANSGETLNLEDPRGENILKFRYSDSWYPNSDGEGSSLVLRALDAPYHQYDNPATWGSSAEVGGSPGFAGSHFETHFNGWQAINFAEEDHMVNRPGHPDSDVDGDGLTTWDEYALGTDVNEPNSFPSTLASVHDGNSVKYGLRTTRRAFTSDVLWELLSSPNLQTMSPVSSPMEADQTSIPPLLESLLIYDLTTPEEDQKHFYQLRISPIELP